jgi:hypothetical protein
LKNSNTVLRFFHKTLESSPKWEKKHPQEFTICVCVHIYVHVETGERRESKGETDGQTQHKKNSLQTS